MIGTEGQVNRMSDDLISRKALLKQFIVSDSGRRIPEYDIDNFPITLSIKDVKDIIRKAPTVFDKEKVIEELVELRQKEYSDSDEEIEIIDGEEIYDEGRSQGRFEAYHRAIKIVEKGGDEYVLSKYPWGEV